jgi:hypothetical protein
MIEAYNMSLDRHYDLLDPFPVVSILSLAVDDLKALQDVDYVIYSPSLDGQFPRALIQIEQRAPLAPIKTQKPPTQLSQTLLLAAVPIRHISIHGLGKDDARL